MIDACISIVTCLNQVDELQHIDIEGSEELGTFPAAYVQFNSAPWQELSQGIMHADATFTVRVVLKPFHRSAGNSPVLNKLKWAGFLLKDIKKVLRAWGDETVQNVVITPEQLRKLPDGKYEARIDGKCRLVEEGI